MIVAEVGARSTGGWLGRMRAGVVALRPSRFSSFNSEEFLMKSTLVGARHKIERAVTHIDELERALEVPLRPGIFALRLAGRYPQITSLFVTIDVPPTEIYPRAMLIAGDAIHNLRSALDHCVWSATERLGDLSDADKRRISFPISRKDRVDYETKQIEKHPALSDDTRRLLLDLEIFPEGRGQDIVSLGDLDNIDKHCTLVPVSLAISISGLKRRVYDEAGNKILVPVKTLRVSPFCASEMINSHFGSHYGGEKIETWDQGRHEGLVHDDNVCFTIRLLFADPRSFEALTVLPTLVRLREAVTIVVERFETMLGARGDPGFAT